MVQSRPPLAQKTEYQNGSKNGFSQYNITGGAYKDTGKQSVRMSNLSHGLDPSNHRYSEQSPAGTYEES